MELKPSALSKLADMICGNASFQYFPYRSSSFLTKFFVELDLEYVHDNSTRNAWVESVLKQLNKKVDPESPLPSIELQKVISSLVNPDHFLFDDNFDHKKAVEDVNKVLKSSGLKLKENFEGQYSVENINGRFISTAIEVSNATKVVTFSPSVFTIPNKDVNEKLLSVMMPFNAAFSGTYSAIKRVADYMGLECQRADDIWENTTIMQDIFQLIYCSNIVVVDFTGRNSNVMYETGIAHTLGKTVIPITQDIEDIPSDIGNHRALKYLPNEEGYRKLSNDLYKKVTAILAT